MSSTILRMALIAAALPACLFAHEGFLPLHEHHPDADHGHSHAHHGHGASPHEHESHGKAVQLATVPHHEDARFSIATGVRYTRYSVRDERAHLWEMAAGFDFAVLPWLHVGGDLSYGWFDSKEGRAEGWLAPRPHVDLHLPLGKGWELTVGVTAGTAGGDEALVGDHWEWTPHVELRHDRGAWFVEAGLGLTFVTGGAHHSDEHEHADHGGSEEDHGNGEVHEEEEHAAHDQAHDASHTAGGDFHEIIHPHGERELEYHLAAGVRLLENRLTLEGRFSGVHVIEGETEARDYLRAGARVAWRFRDSVTVSLEGNAPLTDARRHEWQASVGIGIAF